MTHIPSFVGVTYLHICSLGATICFEKTMFNPEQTVRVNNQHGRRPRAKGQPSLCRVFLNGLSNRNPHKAQLMAEEQDLRAICQNV